MPNYCLFHGRIQRFRRSVVTYKVILKDNEVTVNKEGISARDNFVPLSLI